MSGESKENGGDGDDNGNGRWRRKMTSHTFRTIVPCFARSNHLEARSGSQANGCGTLAYGPQKEASGENG